jgi:hypothetical protein
LFFRTPCYLYSGTLRFYKPDGGAAVLRKQFDLRHVTITRKELEEAGFSEGQTLGVHLDENEPVSIHF